MEFVTERNAGMRNLDVFDFDGTLFRNPEDSSENRRKYEKDKGLPWVIDKQKSRELSAKLGRHVGMRRGWYGRKETLEPPLVPDPAPSQMFLPEPCEAFLASKADPNRLTLLMTGRHLGLRSHVLRIASDGGLVEVKKKHDKKGELICHCRDENVTCMFLGQDGPDPQGTKPSTTLAWKLWILEQFLNDDLETIDIWEDREEHVEEFRKWGEILDQEVIVHYVTGSFS